MRGTARAAGVTVLALVLGCDDSTKAPSTGAQVVEDVVRAAATHVPPDPDKPDALPLVYVVSHSEEPFSARVQAAVANAVNGEIAVRFADDRAEAIDAERPGRPVRDHGALVAIGPLTPADPPMVIELEIYRSETEFSRRTVTFVLDGDDWSPSSSSVLEEIDVAPSSPTSPDEDGAPAATIAPAPGTTLTPP